MHTLKSLALGALFSLASAGAASAATVTFFDQGTFSTPQLDFAGGNVTGSADIYVLNLNGLGIVGGASDIVVDVGEYIDFVFDAPVENVELLVGACGGNFDACGGRTVELFGLGGVSLGSFAQASVGGFDLSALVANALITAFRVTSTIGNFRIYEISFDVAPEIPLPAALPLFLAGLGAMAAASRRRKAAQAD